MEHNPLRNGDNAFLGLIESRELGLDCIIGIRHVSVVERPERSPPVVGLFLLDDVTQSLSSQMERELLVWVLVSRARSRFSLQSEWRDKGQT